MRRMLWMVIVVMAAGGWARAGQTPEDEKGVRATVEHYFRGHATGDAAEFARAFHPDAVLFWIGADGAVMQRTAKAYIAGASGKPAADEASRRRRIVSLDITGDTASVKAVLDYPTVTFTDYFNMVRANGTWLIVNKTYHAARR